MKVIEVKCPNCGAKVSPETMKCQYCGAHLVFIDNTLTLESVSPCPQCGASVGTGSFVCINCGKILTADPKELDIIKTMQKRERFMQNRLGSLLFDPVRERLQPNEFIYHVSGAKGGFLKGKDMQNVVTERRIVRYFDKKFYDILYDDIVTINTPVAIPMPMMRTFLLPSGPVYISHCFVTITTYSGDISFHFSDVPSGEDFYRAVVLAHDNYTFKKKDIKALLCFANV